MNETELEQKIRDCFLAQTLSDKAVNAILEQGAAVKAAGAKRSLWRPWLPIAAAAAVVMLFAFQAAQRYDVSEFADQVAGEIAMRHYGDRPLDVEAHSFDAVQEGLSDLAFSVTPAVRQGLLSAYEILGARYCSLEGQPAAHMRVRNRVSGAFCTLYVTSMKGKLSSLKSLDREVRLKASEVTMWEDSNRLFALVE